MPARRPCVLHVAAVEFTAERLLLPQLRALRERGYNVRLACAPGPSGYSAALTEFDPIPLHFPRSMRPDQMVVAAARLTRIVHRLRPDLVHLHSPAAALPARCLPAAIWPSGTRVLYTVHGFAHQWESSRPRDIVLELAERMLSGRADAILFQSQEDYDEAIAHRYRSRLVYLGNGVGDEWFDPPVSERRSRPLRVLFVGRLVREKGVLDLLDAASSVPSVDLRLAGAELPSDRDGVEDEVRRRSDGTALAGRVRLLGLLDLVRLRQEVAASDVVALPSHREGVPRSLIEGLAAGRPVIATRIRGCRELVVHGVTGLLVESKDVPGLAAALRHIESMPDEIYGAMCIAARRSMVGHREQGVFDRLYSAYDLVGVPA